MPDIAVIAIARLSTEDGPFQGAPDWLIEIRSRDQSMLDLQDKILHCLSHGMALAWLIDIERKQVWVCQGDNLPDICASDDPLPTLGELPVLTVDQAIAMTQER